MYALERPRRVGHVRAGLLSPFCRKIRLVTPAAQTAWVRRPLEAAFGLAIAFVFLAAVVLFARVLFTDVAPFDGRLLEAGVTVLVFVFWIVLGLGIAAIVMWAIFTAVAPALVHQFGKGPAEWSSFAAVSELKRRYARGEMTREDYLLRLEDIERREAPPSPVAR